MGFRCGFIARSSGFILRALACAFFVLALGREGRGQVFEAHSLRLPGEIKEVRAVDLDGDGRKELLVSSTTHVSGRPERTLHACGWSGEGKGVRPVIQEAWRVPPKAVFWDTGPAGAGGKGQHVYFVSLDGLYEVDRLGFAPRLRIEAPVLFSVGQEDELHSLDFVRDWDGDGREETMLPLGREARFYRRKASDEWMPVDSVTLVPLAYYSNNRYFGRDLGGYEYLSVFLYPRLEGVDLNGDGRKDLLALRNGKGFGYLRGPDGKLAPKPFVWDLELRSEKELAEHRAVLSYRVADVNRDGCADVIVHKVSMSFSDWDGETAIFLGSPQKTRKGGPYQTLPSRGFLSGVSLDDLDGDGYADVTVWSVRMGLVPLAEILLRRLIHLRAHTYFGAWPAGFPAKATGERDFNLHIDGDRPDFIRGLMPNRKGDFNRDGIRDLVAGKGDSRAAVFLGLPGRRFDSQPWALLDAPDVNYVEPDDVDGNGLTDLYGYQVETYGLSRLHVWLQHPPAEEP